MWPDWVSNPGPLTYGSDALPTALLCPAKVNQIIYISVCTCMLNIQILAFKDPSIRGSSDILFTRLFLYKCLCQKMGNISTEKFMKCAKQTIYTHSPSLGKI